MAEQEQTVFGTPTPGGDTEADREQFPFLYDDVATEEAPEESTEEAPQASEGETSEVEGREDPALGTSAPVQEESEVAEGEPTETEEEKAERIYANKYTTVEDLEKGYRNSRDQARRYRQSWEAAQDQTRELSEAIQQRERALQEAVWYIQQLEASRQAQAQPPKTLYDEQGQPVQVPQTQPQPQINPYAIQQSFEQRLAQEREQWQAQMGLQQEETARKESILGFYEKHPEVEPHSSLDSDIMDTLRAFSDAWDDDEPDPSNPDMLEIAYEAAKDPALRKVLELNPRFVDDDEGMKLARLQAATLRSGQPITQGSQVVPASEVGQRKPNVEKASTTAPAGRDSQPYDPWREAVEDYRKDERTKAGIW